MRNLERRPGITMHRIAVGGGIMSALFAVGTVSDFCDWTGALQVLCNAEETQLPVVFCGLFS
jgi:hypothetical protein